jgi:hypothetical protein
MESVKKLREARSVLGPCALRTGISFLPLYYFPLLNRALSRHREYVFYLFDVLNWSSCHRRGGRWGTKIKRVPSSRGSDQTLRKNITDQPTPNNHRSIMFLPLLRPPRCWLLLPRRMDGAGGQRDWCVSCVDTMLSQSNTYIISYKTKNKTKFSKN